MFNKWWRVVATGFCFAVFGFGGLVGAFLAPFVLILPNWSSRQRMIRNSIHYWFRFYVELMKYVGVMNLEVSGKEKLSRNGLFILANHPSLIDVVILISLTKNCDCIVKDALWRNPFTWAPIYLAGFIKNVDGPELLSAALTSMERGGNLIVFPEGTRTKPGLPMKFMRGASNIIVRGGVSFTPVIISCSEPTLTKGNPWWNVPSGKPTFKFDVLDDFSCYAPIWGIDDNNIIKSRKLTVFLESFFTEKVMQHESSYRN